MDQKEKETIILEVLTLVRVTGVMRHQELYSALEQLRKGGLPPVAYNELPYFIEENVKEIGVQWCAIYMGGTPLNLDAFFFSKIGTAGQIVLDQMRKKLA